MLTGKIQIFENFEGWRAVCALSDNVIVKVKFSYKPTKEQLQQLYNLREEINSLKIDLNKVKNGQKKDITKIENKIYAIKIRLFNVGACIESVSFIQENYESSATVLGSNESEKLLKVLSFVYNLNKEMNVDKLISQYKDDINYSKK